jgi:hypothetical protein
MIGLPDLSPGLSIFNNSTFLLYLLKVLDLRARKVCSVTAVSSRDFGASGRDLGGVVEAPKGSSMM